MWSLMTGGCLSRFDCCYCVFPDGPGPVQLAATETRVSDLAHFATR